MNDSVILSTCYVIKVHLMMAEEKGALALKAEVALHSHLSAVAAALPTIT